MIFPPSNQISRIFLRSSWRSRCDLARRSTRHFRVIFGSFSGHSGPISVAVLGLACMDLAERIVGSFGSFLDHFRVIFGSFWAISVTIFGPRLAWIWRRELLAIYGLPLSKGRCFPFTGRAGKAWVFLTMRERWKTRASLHDCYLKTSTASTVLLTIVPLHFPITFPPNIYWYEWKFFFHLSFFRDCSIQNYE